MTNDQVPATKADLQRLEERLDVRFKAVQERIDQVLTVLVNVEKRLTKAVDDHEWRLRRIETRLGIAA